MLNANHNANLIIVEVLERHLEKLGLRKAYSGLGAIFTDYLGMKEDLFPFEISADDQKRAEMLMTNILEMGNFGHNCNTSRRICGLTVWITCGA